MTAPKAPKRAAGFTPVARKPALPGDTLSPLGVPGMSRPVAEPVPSGPQPDGTPSSPHTCNTASRGGKIPAAGTRTSAREGRRRAAGASLADQRSGLDLLPERLRSKITVDPSTGCWLWRAVNSRGYGTIRWSGKPRTAHRVVYELLAGPIPDGLTLDHTCHPGDGSCPAATCPHRRCANPAHLEPVTNRENILRGNSPSARAAKVTRCPKDHEYTPENTYIERDGSRTCRKCHLGRKEEQRRRNGIKPTPPRIPCGDDIRVRLPIDLDPVIRRMAAEEGTTAALFMRRLAQEEVARRQAAKGRAVA